MKKSNYYALCWVDWVFNHGMVTSLGEGKL